MTGQDKFIMRQTDDAEVGLGEDCEEVLVLVDVGNNNADLYICWCQSGEYRNRIDQWLHGEAHMEDASLSFMGQDLFYFQPLSLDSACAWALCRRCYKEVGMLVSLKLKLKCRRRPQTAHDAHCRLQWNKF